MFLCKTLPMSSPLLSPLLSPLVSPLVSPLGCSMSSSPLASPIQPPSPDMRPVLNTKPSMCIEIDTPKASNILGRRRAWSRENTPPALYPARDPFASPVKLDSPKTSTILIRREVSPATCVG
eukprot:GILJ01014023.1.p1 GENE.GILJ01014023.1~~GILJ01014023.1.p1  ORF type:complete len:122 (+),score=5.31 GILJ01014023.1:43-408(+)